MHTIIHKQVIAQGIKKLDIMASGIAARALPGQFVMVTPVLGMAPIPMSIIDSDQRRGVISLIVHEVGRRTKILGNLAIGNKVPLLLGPLGSAARIEKYGLVITAATGMGAAQILPICRALKKKGNKVVGIVGAKSKNVLMLESHMRVVCDEMFITTNDGSYERKGLVSDLLKELLHRYTVDQVYAIGSVGMMSDAARMTRLQEIPLWVTLNPYMADGLGVCGSCRVRVDGQYRLACVDGPHFNGHALDYTDLAQRMQVLESHECSNITLPQNLKKKGFKGFVQSLWG